MKVVEHALEFVEQRVGTPALGNGRPLGRERGFAHVAQRQDAAGARGLLDVAPLFGRPDGRLPDGTTGRHDAGCRRCPRAQRAKLGAFPALLAPEVSGAAISARRQVP